MRGLYAILDLESTARHGVDPVEFAKAVLAAQPACFQLRAKGADSRGALELLRVLARLCKNVGVPFYANDRPDLAALAGCDGVHVGQGDLPAAGVRRQFPGLALGLSTHDLEQLDRALEQGPSYVAFGPVFATRSKANPDPVVGLEGLGQAQLRAAPRRCPLVAIGGITLDNAAEVSKHARAAAIIAALLPGAGGLSRVTDTARALHQRLGGR
jgi:thiamine-phosphate pyrophosphorylase